MSFNFRRFVKGITILPKTPLTASAMGDLEVDSTTGKLNYHNGTNESPVVTESGTATLTNKTIDTSGPNTIVNIRNVNIASNAAIDISKISFDSDLIPTIDVTYNIGSNSFRVLKVNTQEVSNTARLTLTGTSLNLNAQSATDPVSAIAGDVYFNTISLNFRYYTGTIWQNFNSGSSGANLTLSNLTSPTSINQDLIPATTATYYLGSSTKLWQALHLGAGGIINTVNVESVDPNGYTLANSTGASTVDWNARQLFITSPSFAATLDWGISQLKDHSSNISIDWQNRLIKNSTATTLIDYSGSSPKFNGLQWPSSDGSAGNVLTTNGSGILTFSPAGSSSPIVASYAWQNAGQTILTSFTVLLPTVQLIDTNSAFNTSTGTFTAPATGYYCIVCSLNYASFNPSQNSLNGLLIKKNNNIVVYGPNTFMMTGYTASWSSNISTVIQLNINDTVTVTAFQGSGTNQLLLGQSASPPFSEQSILTIYKLD